MAGRNPALAVSSNARSNAVPDQYVKITDLTRLNGS
jgi:hypothetical protein